LFANFPVLQAVERATPLKLPTSHVSSAREREERRGTQEDFMLHKASLRCGVVIVTTCQHYGQVTEELFTVLTHHWPVDIQT
jgi:hypothetical protein